MRKLNTYSECRCSDDMYTPDIYFRLHRLNRHQLFLFIIIFIGAHLRGFLNAFCGRLVEEVYVLYKLCLFSTLFYFN